MSEANTNPGPHGFDHVNTRGLVLVGCGKMGSALLAGWLQRGLLPQAVTVIEPAPSAWLLAQAVRLNSLPRKAPAAVVIAVKPQGIGAALTPLAALGPEPLFLSIAAGTTLGTLDQLLGGGRRIVRAMPNTPAAIGYGMTALVGNSAARDDDLGLAESLMAAVGKVIRLADEALMDVVTAVSGSGPAYVFLMVEALQQAGIALGLAPDLAEKLARETVIGAGALLRARSEDAAVLRAEVTSPGGTTAAALSVLMDQATGLAPLMSRAVRAATLRSKELAAAAAAPPSAGQASPPPP